jgi:serine/threonine-protein kinase
VIRQDPGAGTVHRGDTVTLVNSQGPVMVKVPEVRGLGVTAASARLQGAGFQVKVVRMVSGSLGFALRTDPGADKLAPEASTISLYLV